ncbi:MAG: hypothetical protein O2820_22905 [Planctomycetota bacterium]|nr:hypothetical protein [Planctomycetota bacterium]MDA1252068.1 hypothetical protein [Planctomycetota bacterium]
MTPKRSLSEQQLARLDDSQRSLFRALGYEVPEAASPADKEVEDSAELMSQWPSLDNPVSTATFGTNPPR